LQSKASPRTIAAHKAAAKEGVRFDFQDQLTEVKGIGEALARKFDALGVYTVADLIDHFPRRYEDYSKLLSIKDLQPGTVSIEATIAGAKGRYVRRGLHITEAIATDSTESVRLVWFNQPYRAAAIKPGQKYFISGNYELSFRRFAIMNPSAELASDFPLNAARIVPVYRETKGLTSNQIRRVVGEILPLIRRLTETLPTWLLDSQKLMSRAEALEQIHFPTNADTLAQAKERLAFEEVFQLTLASLYNKYELAGEPGVPLPFDETLAKSFVQSLPFKLTNAQRATAWQIYQDMEQAQPMNRLVEGDVGSGKTVVATMVALMAMASGHQAALMAPTELLARQHADTIYTMLERLGLADKLVLLVGGLGAAEKIRAQKHIAEGGAQFIVGTHALIQEKVQIDHLGLAIVDEQHRFGVEQRKTLMGKSGHMPHLLSLTATPIPRSLALTLYGEMDVSILAEKPPGRQPVHTSIVSPNSRAQMYEAVAAQLKAGRQVFVVCPLIAESVAIKSASAEKVYEELSKKTFKQWRVALLHGKMKPDEKQQVMSDFAKGKYDILVATTVIEVGVDVPNASVMLIESADRFGLSQIHQLRGRVGRGGHEGFCYLVMSDSKAPPARLRALERSNDGFKLAELDLELRGPGAIYGSLQHGPLDLRVAKLTDTKLIAGARDAAHNFIDRGEDLLQYPELNRAVTRLRSVTNLN
jgi:ATP-dependent DNA helicase RecG